MVVNPFFLVVSGSRQFSNKSIIHLHLQSALKKQPKLVLVSGGAAGADQIVRSWAVANKVPFLSVPAHWQRFGKAAGPIRNSFMLSIASGLLAFPLASSKGTVSIIRQARKLGLPTKVVQP